MGSLKRVLGYPAALLITINAIIGSGVFFLPAVGASISGNASIISWILLAVMALYISMCFAELVSMFPKAGGIYEFSKQAYGRFPSFMIGWISWLVGNITAAMLVVGGIDYLLPVESFLESQLPTVALIKTVISLFIILLFNYVAYRGMKISAGVLIAFAIITISLVLGIIIPAIPMINLSYFSDLWSWQTIKAQNFLIFITIFFIAETFFGHEAVCYLSEETHNPEKNIPKALVIGTIIISLLVISLVIASLGVIPASEFGKLSAPYASLTQETLGPWSATPLKLLTYLVIIGAAAGWVITAPRLLLSLAKDRLFPQTFESIHDIYGTPHKAIGFQAIASSLFILLAVNGSGYRTLLEILVPLVLIMLSAVLLCVPVLRIKYPKIKRTYKAPLAFFLPFILIIVHLAMIYFWFMHTEGAKLLFATAGSVVIFGIPIYVLIMAINKPEVARYIRNLASYLELVIENITAPVSARKRIVNYLKPLQGKSILDLGCGIGGLTKLMADKVGPEGKVFAIDTAEHDIDITRKRLRNYSNIVAWQVSDYTSIPSRKYDAVVASGSASEISDLSAVLRRIGQKLNPDGIICFMEHNHFFWLLPNIEWIDSDEKIRQIFEDSGLEVKIERKRGLLWSYIYMIAQKRR